MLHDKLLLNSLSLSANNFVFIPATSSVYLMGGIDTAAPTNKIIKFLTSNETSSIILETMPVSLYGTSSVWNNIKTYLIGGHTGSGSSLEIQGLYLDTETAFNPSAAAVYHHYYGCGLNGNNKGYVLGGANPFIPSYTPYSIIEEIFFSTDTIASYSVTTSAGEGYSQTPNGAETLSNGYIQASNSGTATNNIIKFNPSSGTVNRIVNAIDTARLSPAVFQTTDYMYCFSGQSSSDISKFNMINDTNLAVTITAPVTVGYALGAETTTNGYALGGYTSSTSSEIQGINFSTDTTTNSGATLATVKRLSGGAQK